MVASAGPWAGAARVAVGPDIAPYFTDDIALAQALEQAAQGESDLAGLDAAEQKAELLGICDLDAEKRGKAAAEYGVTPYTDYREMLAREGRDHLVL